MCSQIWQARDGPPVGRKASRRAVDSLASGAAARASVPRDPPLRGTDESTAYPSRLRAIHLSQKPRSPLRRRFGSNAKRPPSGGGKAGTPGDRPLGRYPNSRGYIRLTVRDRRAGRRGYDPLGMRVRCSPAQRPAFEHAGRHADLAQRRSTGPGALGPRGSHPHERLLKFGKPCHLVALGEVPFNVEPLLNQFDLTDRGPLVGDPLLDLGTTLLKVGPAACRKLRRPQRRQLSEDRIGFRSPLASFRRTIRPTPRHPRSLCPPSGGLPRPSRHHPSADRGRNTSP
jgi:hypothetical protein